MSHLKSALAAFLESWRGHATYISANDPPVHAGGFFLRETTEAASQLSFLRSWSLAYSSATCRAWSVRVVLSFGLSFGSSSGACFFCMPLITGSRRPGFKPVIQIRATEG
jgi:hypothetical protein